MVDPGNRERGLKAAIKNPRVSEQAKERDRKILETEFGEHFEESPIEPLLSGRETSSELEYEEVAPQKARQTSGVRSAATQQASRASEMSSSAGAHAAATSSAGHDGIEGKDAGNIIRGLKSAITNPNVSEQAKEKDRKKLRDLGQAVE